MDECNAPSTRPGARHLVHQTVSLPAAGLEGLVEVGDAVTNVMDTGAAALEEFRDGTVGVARGKKLDLALPQRQGNYCGAVGVLGRMGCESQDIPIECQSGFDIRHGDTHMGDAGLVGHDEQGNRSRGQHE